MKGATSLLPAVIAALALVTFFALPSPPPREAALVDDGEPRARGVANSGRSRLHGRIVDVHTHIHPAALDEALRIFDERGVALAVNLLPVSYSERNWEVVREMERRAQGRLIHFVGVAWEELARGDGFGERMAANLEAAVAAGARGLKIPKALGLGVPSPEGARLAVDDSRLDPLFAKAGDLGVPVAIHVGDPVAFWEPVTPENERYDELSRNPGWSNFGRDVPSHAELMAEQRRRFARHPGTRFLAVHVAGFPEDLTYVSALLDELPNVSVDIAARIPALGHHPADEARAFFLAHSDRILFGTDLGVSPGNLMLGAPLAWPETDDDVERFFTSTWRYLESADRGFPHPTPIQGRWTIDGLALPDRVLEALYRTNAIRLLEPTRKP